MRTARAGRVGGAAGGAPAFAVQGVPPYTTLRVAVRRLVFTAATPPAVPEKASAAAVAAAAAAKVPLVIPAGAIRRLSKNSGGHLELVVLDTAGGGDRTLSVIVEARAEVAFTACRAVADLAAANFSSLLFSLPGRAYTHNKRKEKESEREKRKKMMMKVCHSPNL
jgi:hypothetical protein